jgi:invasion protein IalB
MRHSLRWAVTVIVASLVQAQPASAQTPKFLGNHRDWTVYEVDDGKGKICYIASEPVNQEGNYAKRGNPAVLVARLPGDPPGEQVSVQPGYAYRKGSMVEVKVEGRNFQLFTQGEHAWARTDADDKALIEAMRRGSDMTVRGTSVRDTFSLDTYSLNGFSAAYDAMRDACSG